MVNSTRGHIPTRGPATARDRHHARLKAMRADGLSKWPDHLVTELHDQFYRAYLAFAERHGVDSPEANMAFWFVAPLVDELDHRRVDLANAELQVMHNGHLVWPACNITRLADGALDGESYARCSCGWSSATDPSTAVLRARAEEHAQSNGGDLKEDEWDEEERLDGEVDK